ncbi:hypothetical protein MAM1_0005d00600 [Mucor ambiguus]|uniref:Uncharacterized protein n=1 Tax=Mucor ambiguus TaxID=91626 RepID=A0A0C9M4F9_9FUNG|nr:hypothetical protein MAM1_0005d00600 [Mucor ambiguus]
MEAVETTIKVLGHVNMPLSIAATNFSFEDENEDDAVNHSKSDNNGGPANAVEAKVVNGHAEQEAMNDVALPSTAK